MTLKFYKELDNRWYVNIDSWQGDKSDLEMVCGADTMLDILAQGENEIYLRLENKQDIVRWMPKVTLTKSNEEVDSGSFYQANYHLVTSMKIWLCSVTTYVFGNYPDKIYIY